MSIPDEATLEQTRHTLQWFRVPAKVFFEPYSVRYLAETHNINKVMIVSDRSMERLGYTHLVMDVLKKRPTKPEVEIFLDIDSPASIPVVEQAMNVVNTFQPDTFIAIGGGSVMDAAKVMWFMYEHPDLTIDTLSQGFAELAHKGFNYPLMDKKARLYCLPTVPGSGSEVTPLALLVDKDGKRIPMADYSLIPTVAIVDPMFTKTLSKELVIEGGMNTLGHALESYASQISSEYTDGLAMQASKMVFNYLVKSLDGDMKARENVHNASTIAGMAYGTCFLGIAHSLAHGILTKFHIAHGHLMAILLPKVIRFNGKTNPEKYVKLAKCNGCTFNNDAEAVEALAKKVEELAKQLELPNKLREEGIKEEEFNAAIKDIATYAMTDGSTQCNARKVTESDLAEFLKEVY